MEGGQGGGRSPSVSELLFRQNANLKKLFFGGGGGGWRGRGDWGGEGGGLE